MRSFAVILEDSANRITEFRNQLCIVAGQLEPIFFDAADDAIAWLRSHQANVSLISLDHDLPITRTIDGKLRDFGTGRMVCDFLATTAPTCPVIVHTSNATAGLQMMAVLGDSGWPVVRVYPADDVAWIAKEWSGAVLKFMANGLLAGDGAV